MSVPGGRGEAVGKMCKDSLLPARSLFQGGEALPGQHIPVAHGPVVRGGGKVHTAREDLLKTIS